MSYCTVVNLSWGSIVVIVTRLQNGQLRFCGSIVGRRNIFFSTPKAKASRLALGLTQTLIHRILVPFPGVWSRLLSLICAQVKDEWHCNYTSLCMYRDNFMLTVYISIVLWVVMILYCYCCTLILLFVSIVILPKKVKVTVSSVCFCLNS